MICFDDDNVGINDETFSVMAVEFATTDPKYSEAVDEVSVNRLEVMLIMSVINIICLE